MGLTYKKIFIYFFVFTSCYFLTYAGEDFDAPDDSNLSQESFDPRIPLYKQIRTQWGFEFTGSLNTFHGGRLPGNAPAHSKVRSISAQVDYQPQSWQKYGVIGFGPSFAVYPVTPKGLSPKPFGIWSLGAQLRYQARYWREQPIVPIVGFSAEYWYYRFAGYAGQVIATAPFAGLWFLLNFVDQESSATFYVEQGIARTYLVAEAKALSAQNADILFDGISYFFGLRFEL